MGIGYIIENKVKNVKVLLYSNDELMFFKGIFKIIFVYVSV